MNLQPFTHENIDYVINRLWERGKEETAQFGMSIDDLRKQYIEKIDAPFSLAFYDGNIPCALCYIECVSPPAKHRTHFIATEEGFNAIWLPLTLFLRKISDRMVGDGLYIEILTNQKNERVKEWYVAMGFSYHSSQKNFDKYVKFDKIKSTHQDQAIGHGARL